MTGGGSCGKYQKEEQGGINMEENISRATRGGIFLQRRCGLSTKWRAAQHSALTLEGYKWEVCVWVGGGGGYVVRGGDGRGAQL